MKSTLAVKKSVEQLSKLIRYQPKTPEEKTHPSLMKGKGIPTKSFSDSTLRDFIAKNRFKKRKIMKTADEFKDAMRSSILPRTFFVSNETSGILYIPFTLYPVLYEAMVRDDEMRNKLRIYYYKRCQKLREFDKDDYDPHLNKKTPAGEYVPFIQHPLDSYERVFPLNKEMFQYFDFVIRNSPFWVKNIRYDDNRDEKNDLLAIRVDGINNVKRMKTVIHRAEHIEDSLKHRRMFCRRMRRTRRNDLTGVKPRCVNHGQIVYSEMRCLQKQGASVEAVSEKRFKHYILLPEKCQQLTKAVHHGKTFKTY